MRFSERLILVLVVFSAMWLLWPFSFWYDMGEVYVYDTEQGQPIKMVHSGTVKRDFRGIYTVNVRLITNNRSVICEGKSGPYLHKKSSSKPVVTNLDLWVGKPNCTEKVQKLLSVYEVETCRKMYIGPFSKGGCVTSNVFKILPKGHSADKLQTDQQLMRNELEMLQKQLDNISEVD